MSTFHIYIYMNNWSAKENLPILKTVGGVIRTKVHCIFGIQNQNQSNMDISDLIADIIHINKG